MTRNEAIDWLCNTKPGDEEIKNGLKQVVEVLLRDEITIRALLYDAAGRVKDDGGVTG